MTAIVRTLTPQGFVLAADGRNSGAVDGTVFSDSVQKIFPIKTPSGAFAYSVSGTVQILTDDCREIAVDMINEVSKSAESLAERKTKDLTGYAVRLCRPICQVLNDAHESGRFSQYPSYEQKAPMERGDTLVRICIDGFRHGYPSSVTIRLFHENEQLCEPEIITVTNHLGLNMTLGRPEIGRLLWGTDDPRFAPYRRTSPACNLTLQDAIDRSRSFILAHTDPEAVAIDPHCGTIGGHIHIATITPSTGFEWVVAPVNSQDLRANRGKALG
jgi:hypothetical protein